MFILFFKEVIKFIHYEKLMKFFSECDTLFIYNLLRFILVLMKWKWIYLVFKEFILQYILYKYIVPLKNQNEIVKVRIKKEIWTWWYPRQRGRQVGQNMVAGPKMKLTPA